MNYLHIIILTLFVSCSNAELTNENKEKFEFHLQVEIDTTKYFQELINTKQSIGNILMTVDSTGFKKYYKDSLIEHAPYCIKFPGNLDTVRISFESGFTNDHIKMWIDDKLSFNDTLNTNDLIGLANTISCNKGKHITLQLNNAKKNKTAMLSTFDVITINKNEDVITLSFTNNNYFYY